MPIILQILTTNCGNGGLGPSAISAIECCLAACDVLVLNCQEADFLNLEQELGRLNPQFFAKMTTHTKAKTHFHQHSGLVTVVMTRDQAIDIECLRDQPVRRQGWRFKKGYNKGGTVTEFKLSKGGESYRILDVNAHLDAFNAAARAQDWANLQAAMLPDLADWAGLVAQLPDLQCAGYDANTRNTAKGSPWEAESIPAEIQALFYCPIGRQWVSAASTYKAHIEGIETLSDPQRPGYFRGGRLDFVCWQRHEMIAATGEATINIPSVANERRDHALIGGPLLELKKINDFDRVRDYLASCLGNINPDLACRMMNLADDTLENQAYLLDVYKKWLAPEGLLHKRLALQVQKLKLWQRLDIRHAELRDAVNATLFQSWQGDETRAQWQIALDRLQCEALNQARGATEIYLVTQIIQQALLSPDSESLLGVERLLKINHLLHDYEYHLHEVGINSVEATEQSNSLGEQKLAVIRNLKAILNTREQLPELVLSQLNQAFSQNAEILKGHRNNDPFSRIWRRLCMLIFGHAPAVGESFVEAVSGINDLGAH